MHKVLTKHLPEEFYRKIKIAQTIYQDFKKLTEKSGPQFMQFIVIIYHAQKIAMHAVHYTQYTRHFKIFRPKNMYIFNTIHDHSSKVRWILVYSQRISYQSLCHVLAIRNSWLRYYIRPRSKNFYVTCIFSYTLLFNFHTGPVLILCSHVPENQGLETFLICT